MMVSPDRPHLVEEPGFEVLEEHITAWRSKEKCDRTKSYFRPKEKSRLARAIDSTASNNRAKSGADAAAAATRERPGAL
jgi:hypothetical protein